MGPYKNDIGPVKCVKNEIHNILSVFRLTKQQTSHTRFQVEVTNNNESPILRVFQTLYDFLLDIDDFQLEINHLEPFLDVIRAPDTNGPITAAALAAINKFVSYGFLFPELPTCGQCINAIASGVLACRFEASGTKSDEVVLLKVLSVLDDTLRCDAGAFLTDAVVWQMLKKAFQISRIPRASQVLRSSAEEILHRMILTIFSTTSQRKELAQRVMNSNEHSHLTGTVQLIPYGADSTWRALKFLAWLSCVSPDSPSLIFSRRQLPSVLSEQKEKLDQSSDSFNSNTQQDESPAIAVSGKNGSLSSPSPIGDEEAFRFASIVPSSRMHEKQEICLEVRSLALNLLNVALETGGKEAAENEFLVAVVQDDICRALLVNSRSPNLLILSASLRCVFNIFFHFKRFLRVQLEVFLLSIHLRIAASSPLNHITSSSSNSNNNNNSIKPSAEELSTLLEQRELALESLVEFCREPEIVTALYENYDLQPGSTSLFETIVTFLNELASPQGKEAIQEHSKYFSLLASNLRSDHAHHFADAIEPYISPKPFSALHKVAFNGLAAIINGIAAKCSLDAIRSNSQNNILTAVDLSKSCSQQNDNHHSNDLADITSPSIASQSKVSSQLLVHSDSILDGTVFDAAEAAIIKAKKDLKERIHAGAKEFERSKKKALPFLQQLGLLPPNYTPKDVAHFFLTTPGLSLVAVGEVIGSENTFCQEILNEFMAGIKFTGMNLLDALRLTLSKFSLPGEGQIIARIMTAFSEHYFNQQPVAQNARILPNAANDVDLKDPLLRLPRVMRVDTDVTLPLYVPPSANEFEEVQLPESHSTYSVPAELWTPYLQVPINDESNKTFVIATAAVINVYCFSVIMLNTDLHNPNMSSDKKMSKAAYLKQFRKANENTTTMDCVFERIYDVIQLEPFMVVSGTPVDDPRYWDKMLIRAIGGLGGGLSGNLSLPSGRVVAGVHEKEMWGILESQGALSTLLLIFNSTKDLHTAQTCIKTILSHGTIGRFFNLPSTVDASVLALAKNINYAMSARSQLVLPAVFQSLAQNAPSFGSAGWSTVLEVVLVLYCLGLLSNTLLGEMEDFPDVHGVKLSPALSLRPPPLRTAFEAAKKEKGPEGTRGGLLGAFTSFLFAGGDNEGLNSNDSLHHNSSSGSGVLSSNGQGSPLQHPSLVGAVILPSSSNRSSSNLPPNAPFNAFMQNVLTHQFNPNLPGVFSDVDLIATPVSLSHPSASIRIQSTLSGSLSVSNVVQKSSLSNRTGGNEDFSPNASNTADFSSSTDQQNHHPDAALPIHRYFSRATRPTPLDAFNPPSDVSSFLSPFTELHNFVQAARVDALILQRAPHLPLSSFCALVDALCWRVKPEEFKNPTSLMMPNFVHAWETCIILKPNEKEMESFRVAARPLLALEILTHLAIQHTPHPSLFSHNNNNSDSSRNHFTGNESSSNVNTASFSRSKSFSSTNEIVWTKSVHLIATLVEKLSSMASAVAQAAPPTGGGAPPIADANVVRTGQLMVAFQERIVVSCLRLVLKLAGTSSPSSSTGSVPSKTNIHMQNANHLLSCLFSGLISNTSFISHAERILSGLSFLSAESSSSSLPSNQDRWRLFFPFVLLAVHRSSILIGGAPQLLDTQPLTSKEILFQQGLPEHEPAVTVAARQQLPPSRQECVRLSALQCLNSWLKDEGAVSAAIESGFMEDVILCLVSLIFTDSRDASTLAMTRLSTLISELVSLEHKTSRPTDASKSSSSSWWIKALLALCFSVSCAPKANRTTGTTLLTRLLAPPPSMSSSQSTSSQQTPSPASPFSSAALLGEALEVVAPALILFEFGPSMPSPQMVDQLLKPGEERESRRGANASVLARIALESIDSLASTNDGATILSILRVLTKAASSAPPDYSDAFLESIKNLILVSSTVAVDGSPAAKFLECAWIFLDETLPSFRLDASNFLPAAAILPQKQKNYASPSMPSSVQQRASPANYQEEQNENDRQSSDQVNVEVQHEQEGLNQISEQKDVGSTDFNQTHEHSVSLQQQQQMESEKQFITQQEQQQAYYEQMIASQRSSKLVSDSVQPSSMIQDNDFRESNQALQITSTDNHVNKNEGFIFIENSGQEQQGLNVDGSYSPPELNSGFKNSPDQPLANEQFFYQQQHEQYIIQQQQYQQYLEQQRQLQQQGQDDHSRAEDFT